jgi:hypothetical protein
MKLALQRSHRMPQLPGGLGMLGTLVLGLGGLLLTPAAVGAQHAHKVAQGPGDHEHGARRMVSGKARW